MIFYLTFLLTAFLTKKFICVGSRKHFRLLDIIEREFHNGQNKFSLFLMLSRLPVLEGE